MFVIIINLLLILWAYWSFKKPGWALITFPIGAAIPLLLISFYKADDDVENLMGISYFFLIIAMTLIIGVMRGRGYTRYISIFIIVTVLLTTLVAVAFALFNFLALYVILL